MEGHEAVPARRTSPLAIGILAILAALPLLLPPVQALIDLPTHLAQYHVANSINGSAALQRWFVFTWRPIPNLGVDLLVAMLGPVLGDELATRLVVAAIPSLTALGLLLVARTAHGGRVPATSLMALPLAYSYSLAYGFVNSALGVGLAFLLFAPWLGLTHAGRWGWRLALSLVAAPLLFFTHIMGLGVFGLMTGGAMLARSWRRDRPWAAVWETFLACAPLAWPLVLTALWHLGQKGTTYGWLNLSTKALWTIGLMRDGWAPFDLLSAALLFAIAALPLWARNRFVFLPELGLPAFLLWMASLGLPTRLMGSEFAAVRLISAACAMTLLAVAPRRPLAPWATSAALACVLVRWTTNAVSLLAAGNAAVAELGALDRVAPGSRVIAFYVVPCARSWAVPRFEHLASFATTRRDAFVNDDFTDQEGQLLARRMAADPALLRSPQAIVTESRSCKRGWPDLPLEDALQGLPWGHFDYLWLINGTKEGQPLDPRLVEIHHGPLSRLYRVGNR